MNETIAIDSRMVELIPDADLSHATAVQAQMYRYLADLPSPVCTVKQLMQQFELTIPQPIWSRLEHLAEKGLVKLY